MLILLLNVVLLSLTVKLTTSELVLEPGYTVSTVHDFNKAPSTVHPFALLPRHRDLILLDSTNSAFYSLPIPVSHQSEASLFSGKGVAGFSDGDRSAAMFDRPKSFAVDGRDNVYVADPLHGTIRKITASGFTTTIAGGYSKKEGHIDGPAQNASFSNNFDLVYVPTMCALLISDRATRFIRQIDLKPEDCSHKSQSGLGAVPVSAIAILCLLFGAVFGFVARPFFATREVYSNHFISQTWKHYQTILGRVMLMACSVARSAVANSTICELILRLVNLSLCYLSVVFRNISLERRVQSGREVSCKFNQYRETVSILDSDKGSDHGMQKPHFSGDHLKDLITFEKGMDALKVNKCSSEQKDGMEDGSNGSSSKVDDMIRANLSAFGDESKQKGQNPGLVQRKQRMVDMM